MREPAKLSLTDVPGYLEEEFHEADGVGSVGHYVGIVFLQEDSDTLTLGNLRYQDDSGMQCARRGPPSRGSAWEG